VTSGDQNLLLPFFVRRFTGATTRHSRLKPGLRGCMEHYQSATP